jgi:hypothetical protein
MASRGWPDVTRPIVVAPRLVVEMIGLKMLGMTRNELYDLFFKKRNAD